MKNERQMPFDWENPKATNNKEAKYEYKPQFDQSMVSEYIDHHEQSLLPHVQKHEEVVKKTFEIRILGIKLFTVNY